uniref:Glycosyltransferase n=1 Tax=Aegilops tauschii TaxID=37682 RepID=M8CT04_AEGTA
MEPVAVVAVPFPAQGHLNQLLHLSLQLASRRVDVHYAAPAQHIWQARARVHGWGEEALHSIQSRPRHPQLRLPAPDPPPCSVAPPPDPPAASPFPSHLMPMFKAYIAGARAPLAALLDKLSGSYRRIVVVHAPITAFAAEEAARLPNGESLGLHCLAVSMLLGRMDANHRLLRENGLVYSAIEECATKEFVEYANRARPTKDISPGAGILANTCRALEEELFTIGPLNPLLDASAPKESKQRHECLNWLDEQPPASVLYVSFGTTSSLRAEQIEELAAALRGSNQRFIWVLRDADRGDIFAEAGKSCHEELLSEFTKHTEGRGLVITGWAPQLEILAHSATAAFMSHCGWNSTMESLSHGKPILAWPMHCDQPWDAELICNYLKAGILVRPWEKHSEVVTAKAIQEVIEEAMLSDKGMAVRQRARVLGDAVPASVSDGGSSRQDLDDFTAYIRR